MLKNFDPYFLNKTLPNLDVTMLPRAVNSSTLAFFVLITLEKFKCYKAIFTEFFSPSQIIMRGTICLFHVISIDQPEVEPKPER